MGTIRTIAGEFRGTPTMDGAGVRLNRVFGFSEEGLFDPFLLLDFFGSDNPKEYQAGFPWHPHRGMETVTYMLEGLVEHGDSLGNKGMLGKGDVQWMTAGSGIIHQEMPKPPADGRMFGFQLWVNLPASHKMMPPRYQDIPSASIPGVLTEDSIKVKVIAGSFQSVKGPVSDIVADPLYLDVTVPVGAEFILPVNPGYTVFAVVFEGSGYFSPAKDYPVGSITAVLLKEGDEIFACPESEDFRFLLISGKALNEPVAWRCPIVMNTEDELRQAFKELQHGTFIK